MWTCQNETAKSLVGYSSIIYFFGGLFIHLYVYAVWAYMHVYPCTVNISQQVLSICQSICCFSNILNAKLGLEMYNQWLPSEDCFWSSWRKSVQRNMSTSILQQIPTLGNRSQNSAGHKSLSNRERSAPHPSLSRDCLDQGISWIFMVYHGAMGIRWSHRNSICTKSWLVLTEAQQYR